MTRTALGLTGVFSGFSVDDLERAKAFYGRTLGLAAVDQPWGLGLRLEEE